MFAQIKTAAAAILIFDQHPYKIFVFLRVNMYECFNFDQNLLLNGNVVVFVFGLKMAEAAIWLHPRCRTSLLLGINRFSTKDMSYGSTPLFRVAYSRKFSQSTSFSFVLKCPIVYLSCQPIISNKN